MIYDHTSNASFSKKIKSVQYNLALAITGTVQVSSHEKLHQKLGLEYLYRRRWAGRLCLLYKVFSTGHPSNVYDLLQSMRSFRRHVNSFNMVSCKSEYFKNSFIPNVINDWNYLRRFYTRRNGSGTSRPHPFFLLLHMRYYYYYYLYFKLVQNS